MVSCVPACHLYATERSVIIIIIIVIIIILLLYFLVVYKNSHISLLNGTLNTQIETKALTEYIKTLSSFTLKQFKHYYPTRLHRPYPSTQYKHHYKKKKKKIMRYKFIEVLSWKLYAFNLKRKKSTEASKTKHQMPPISVYMSISGSNITLQRY